MRKSGGSTPVLAAVAGHFQVSVALFCRGAAERNEPGPYCLLRCVCSALLACRDGAAEWCAALKSSLGEAFRVLFEKHEEDSHVTAC